MPLSPDAQKFLQDRANAGSRDVFELSVADARKQSLAFAAVTNEQVAHIVDMDIPGAYGAIPLRLYYPRADATQLHRFHHI